MSIEEVIKHTTIEFPRLINLRESEKLIDYLAKKMPADIDYNLSFHKEICNDRCRKGTFIADTDVDITATIRGDTRYFPASESCQFKKSIDRPELFAINKLSGIKLSAIKFVVIPNYELHNYSQETKCLWSKVRNVVKEYFSLKK